MIKITQDSRHCTQTTVRTFGRVEPQRKQLETVGTNSELGEVVMNDLDSTL